MSFITKTKLEQWVQSSLQLKRLSRWDIFKLDLVVSAVLNSEHF